MLDIALTPEDFPVGVTGKVLKRELRDRYSDLAAVRRRPVEPGRRRVHDRPARQRGRVMIGNWLSTLVPEPGARRRLGLGTGIYNIGTGMFMTSSVLYFTEGLGLSVTEVGLWLAVAGLIGLFAGVPMGHLADRRGPRGVAALSLVVLAVTMVGYVFVTHIWMFVVVTVVEMLATAASRASRGGLIRRVGGEGAAAYRSQLRAIENAGVGIGAAVGGLALTLDTLAAYQVLFLANAATFLIGAWVCARLPHFAPLPAPPGTRPGVALRDKPFIAYTILNGVMSLQYAVITFALPLWIAMETNAPRWMVGAVLIVNTIGVVALQVWVGRKVETVRQGAAAMRIAGFGLPGRLRGRGGVVRPAGVGLGRGLAGGGGRPLRGRDVPRGSRVRAEFRAGAGPRAERVRGPAGHGPRRRVCGGARGARFPVPGDRAGRLVAARRAAHRGGSGDRARRPVGGPKPALPRVGGGPRPDAEPPTVVLATARFAVRPAAAVPADDRADPEKLDCVVLDDDSRFILDRDCVVGRNPTTATPLGMDCVPSRSTSAPTGCPEPIWRSAASSARCTSSTASRETASPSGRPGGRDGPGSHRGSRSRGYQGCPCGSAAESCGWKRTPRGGQRHPRCADRTHEHANKFPSQHFRRNAS